MQMAPPVRGTTSWRPPHLQLGPEAGRVGAGADGPPISPAFPSPQGWFGLHADYAPPPELDFVALLEADPLTPPMTVYSGELPHTPPPRPQPQRGYRPDRPDVLLACGTPMGPAAARSGPPSDAPGHGSGDPIDDVDGLDADPELDLDLALDFDGHGGMAAWRTPPRQLPPHRPHVAPQARDGLLQRRCARLRAASPAPQTPTPAGGRARPASMLAPMSPAPASPQRLRPRPPRVHILGVADDAPTIVLSWRGSGTQRFVFTPDAAMPLHGRGSWTLEVPPRSTQAVRMPDAWVGRIHRDDGTPDAPATRCLVQLGRAPLPTCFAVSLAHGFNGGIVVRGRSSGRQAGMALGALNVARLALIGRTPEGARFIYGTADGPPERRQAVRRFWRSVLTIATQGATDVGERRAMVVSDDRHLFVDFH